MSLGGLLHTRGESVWLAKIALLTDAPTAAPCLVAGSLSREITMVVHCSTHRGKFEIAAGLESDPFTNCWSAGLSQRAMPVWAKWASALPRDRKCCPNKSLAQIGEREYVC